MSYLSRGPALPPLSRLVAGLAFAIAVPSVILIGLLEMRGVRFEENPTSSFEMIAVWIGQIAMLAIPIGLWRWARMERPLIECTILGAVVAPGPLGFALIVFGVIFDPLATIITWAVVTAMGAAGGAIFWAIATDFGNLKPVNA